VHPAHIADSENGDQYFRYEFDKRLVRSLMNETLSLHSLLRGTAPSSAVRQRSTARAAGGGPLYAKTPAVRRLPGTIILCHETPHGGAGFHDALACAALLPVANNNIRASKGKLDSTDFVLRGAYLGDAIAEGEGITPP
jgi:hypothetical protein